MGVQESEVKLSEFIEARQMPRRVFEQLPEVEHDDVLTYVGWVDESVACKFVAERKKGEFVRVDGESVWDALARQYGDSDGNICDGCCGTGEMELVKGEFRGFRERLPQISLK